MIEKLRTRQVKNFLTVTLLSLGLPMILMGDEVRRSQHGNNNDYCHDDESNWFDWSLLEKHADVHRFVKVLLARRGMRNEKPQRQRKSLDQLIREAPKAWHGVKPLQPDWSDGSHSLAFGAEIKKDNLGIHFILNGYWEPLQFELPPLQHGAVWQRWIDTALDTPNDITDWQAAPAVSGTVYSVEARSVVVLITALQST
jgi:glycogen operon protein